MDIITPTGLALILAFSSGVDAGKNEPVNPCLFETVSISTGGYSYETTKFSSGLYTVNNGKCVKK